MEKQLDTAAPVSAPAEDVTPPAAEVPPEKTFTQSEVSRIMTKEKNQGRTAAYHDLGIDPKNAQQLDAVKKWIESQKPDAQKIAEKQIEENSRLQEMQNRAFLAEVKAEVLQAGIQKDYLDDASALIHSRKNDDGFDISKAVDTMKQKYPIWFTESVKAESEKPAGSKGTGSPIQPGRKEEKAEGIGARLAKQRQEGTAAKSSYWQS